MRSSARPLRSGSPRGRRRGGIILITAPHLFLFVQEGHRGGRVTSDVFDFLLSYVNTVTG